MTDSTSTSTSTSIPKATASDPKSQPYDAAWYTWSKFFDLLSGKGNDEDFRRYMHMRYLKSEERDCRRCEKQRDWVFAFSPVVRFLNTSLGKLGGELNSSNVVCKRCDTLGTGGLRAGAFHPDKGILLCANHTRTKGEVEDVLAHEMVHAYDHLRFEYDAKDLRHYACSEIRAQTLSGECRWVREFWTRGQFGFTAHFQDCVRRRASLSVGMHPSCKDQDQAKRVVNDVWGSCFKDTRPFDEIYR